MNTSNILSLLENLEIEVGSVQRLVTEINSSTANTEDRLSIVENYLKQEFNSGGITKQDFLRFSSFANISEDYGEVHISDIVNQFNRPEIIYEGGTSVRRIKNLTNQKKTINLLEYFTTNESIQDLKFFIHHEIENLELRENKYRNGQFVIENMNNSTYLLDSSNLILVPDYRGTDIYHVLVFALDNSKVNSWLESGLHSAKSDLFIFEISESELPEIRTINKEIRFGLGNLTTQRISLEENNNIILDIDYDQNNPITTSTLQYSLRTQFITVSNETSNIELSVSLIKDEEGYSNLEIVPDLRGLNGEDLEYEVIVDIYEPTYNLRGEFKVKVIEPPPLKRNFDEEPYLILSNNEASVNLEGMLISELSNIILYNISSDTIPFTFNNNIVSFKGEYRGTYDNAIEIKSLNIIEVEGKDCNFQVQKAKFNIYIEEFAPPPPIKISENIVLGEVTNYHITCNLENTFISGTDNTDNTDLIYNIIGSYNTTLFQLENTSNIIIKPELKRINTYSSIKIEAIDTKYNVTSISNNIENYLTLSVTEKASVETISISNKTPTNKDFITINLDNYYTSPINSTLTYSFEATIRNDKVDINQQGIELIGSILTIKPDYRDKTYTITVNGYDPNYSDYINDYGIQFQVTEIKAPLPIRTNINQSDLELTIGSEIIDLSNKFESPISSSLSYEIFEILYNNEIYNITEFETLFEENIITISDNNLTILPDVRNIQYIIKIKAKDIIYNVYSTEFLQINITERQPVEIAYNITNYIDIGNDEIIIDLNTRFQSTISEPIIYELIYDNTIRQNYNDNSYPLTLSDTNLIIKGDYRNITYNVQLKAYNASYNDQKVSIEFSITEIKNNKILPFPILQKINSFDNKEQIINLKNYFNNNYFDLKYNIRDVEKRHIDANIVNIFYNTTNHTLYYDNTYSKIFTNVSKDVIYELDGVELDIYIKNTTSKISQYNNNKTTFIPQGIQFTYTYNTYDNDKPIKEIKCISNSNKRIYLWYEGKKLYYVNEMFEKSRHIINNIYMGYQYHIINTESITYLQIENPGGDILLRYSGETNKQYFEPTVGYINETQGGKYRYYEKINNIEYNIEFFYGRLISNNTFYEIKIEGANHELKLYNMGNPLSPLRFAIDCYDAQNTTYNDNLRLNKEIDLLIPLIINKPEQTEIRILNLGDELVELNVNDYITTENKLKNINIELVDVKDKSNIIIPLSTYNIGYSSGNNLLSLNPLYRGLNYEVNIKVSDNDIPTGSTISDIKFSINELTPIEINNETTFNKNILNLGNIDVECNLNDLFIIHKDGTKVFTITLISSNNLLETGVYTGLEPYELIDDRIHIHPEYRNINYELDIELYINEYSSYKLKQRIEINEDSIPEIILNSDLTNELLDLKTNVIECNLDDYFNNYPYNTQLKYTCNLSDYNSDVQIIDNILRINPNLRGNSYTINIFANDEYKINSINNDLLFTISELNPIDINNEEYISIKDTFCNLGRTNINYDLNNLFIMNDTLTYKIDVNSDTNYKLYYSNLSNIEYNSITNILNINSEYRNDSYEIIIDGYLIGYESQKKTISLIVHEKEIPQLLFTEVSSLDHYLLIKTPIIFDINTFFSGYPYLDKLNIDVDIYPNITNNSTPYQYTLDNNNLLTIYPNVRGMNYQVKVILEDTTFNQYNSNMIINISEKPPVDRLPVALPNFYNIYNDIHTYDLNNLFQIIVDTSNILKYDIDYVDNGIICNIPIGQFNGNKPSIQIKDTSNLEIIGEFRNNQYNARIYAYIDDYPNQKYEVDISIAENDIPPLEDKSHIVEPLSNLTYEEISIDLTEYYYYHRLEDTIIYTPEIIFKSKETLNRTAKPIRIENTSNLIICPNVNDYYYDIMIIALIPGFNVVNSNIIFRIHEESINGDLTFEEGYILSNLEPLELNISDYYKSYFTSFYVEFDGYVPRQSHYISKVNAFELVNGDELTIYPEYRGESYQLRIISRLEPGEEESNVYIMNITELNIPEIEFIGNKSYICNLTINTTTDDLSSNFNYPFLDKLKYTSNLINNIGDISISDSILTINPDFREKYYEIGINVYDDKFNKFNNDKIIGIHELAPIYNIQYSEVLCNLTNIELNCNLDSYFIYSEPSLSRTYSYDIKGYKNNIDTIVPIGSYNGGRDPIELIDNLLTIIPEYRNQFIDYYDVNVNVISGSYISQSNNYNFRIYEEQIPEIVEDITLKSIENLSNTLYTFEDIRNIYSTYPYKNQLILSCNIYNTVNPDIEFISKDFNDFVIEVDEGDIKVYPNVRGITYNVRVTVKDQYFGKTNNELILNINEKYPVYVGELIDLEGNNISSQYFSLSNIIVDLNGNYFKSIPEYDLEYEILYIIDPRKALYLPKDLQTIPDGAIYEPSSLFGGKKYNDYRSNAIYIENESNLVISPEYRGESYNVTVKATLKDPLNIYDYSLQSNIQTFILNENDLPNIYMEDSYTSLSNYKLTNVEVNYDLWKFYNKYPFYLDLSYEVKIFLGDSNQDQYSTPILDNKYFNIDEENHILTIKPRYRDNYYILYVNTFDKYEPSNSNNELMIKVSEESIGDGIPDEIYLGHEQAIFNMLDYVVDKDTTFIIESVPVIETFRDGYYNSEKIWEFKNGSNLIFNPEYRNITYEILVTYLDGFGEIVRSNISQITEREIQEIKAFDTEIVTNLKTTKVHYNLDNSYDYVSEVIGNKDRPRPYYKLNYPFNEELIFEILSPKNIIPDIGYNGLLYTFDNSNTITLLPDVRGINYNIPIIARDSNFNLESSNILFNITEEFPIDRISSYNNITENGYELNGIWKEKTRKIDLENYYQNNHHSCNLNYNIYSNNILIFNNNTETSYVDQGVYSDTKQIQLIGCNLYINGDYRNYSYDLRVDAYLEDYSNNHTIDHQTQEFIVTEELIPKIQGIHECNLYNQVLSYNNFQTSELYDLINHPLWDNVYYSLEFTGDEILDRVSINSNTGLLELQTKLEERSKEYSIRVIIENKNDRFINSKNSNVIYNIHELGNIIDIGTITNYNLNNYGIYEIQLENLYNIFQYDNFIENNKKYDEIINFNVIYSNLGTRDLDIKYIDTNTEFGTFPKIEILIDVRGISYDVTLDLSYIGYSTSNTNINFNVIEKQPLEYIDSYTLRKYILDYVPTNDDLNNGLYQILPYTSNNIIDLDTLYQNNGISNIIHEIYSVYEVNKYTNYQEYVSKYLIFYTEFVDKPETSGYTLVNDYGIEGIIIGKDVNTIIPQERKIYPNDTSVKAYVWNDGVDSSDTYIQIDNVIKENDNMTVSYWYKNYDNGTDCNILFDIDNILIYTENTKMNVNVYGNHFENNITNDSEWYLYTNSIKYTDSEIQYTFYIDGGFIEQHTIGLPLLNTNLTNIYIGKTIQNKIALGDIHIYNNVVEDYVISNLYYGVNEDNIYDQNSLRIHKNGIPPYELNGTQLKLETDETGITYDLTIKSYLEGYKDYQELFYTLRIKEDLFTHNFTDGGDLYNVDVIINLDDEYTNYTADSNLFENQILSEISELLGIDVQYLEIVTVTEGSIIVKLRIKPIALSTKSPVGYAYQLQTDNNKFNDSNIILKNTTAVTVDSAISLLFEDVQQVQYDPYDINISTRFIKDLDIHDISYTVFKNSEYLNISIIDSSNIHIIPQARDINYNIEIFGENVEKEIEVRINLSITELPPQIVELDTNIQSNIYPLIIFKEIDLVSYYPTYNRPNRLKFDIITDNPDDILLTNNNKLQLSGNIEGKDYNIQIIAYDEAIPKYENIINCNLFINVKEVFPIELLDVSNIEINNLKLDQIECNLSSYFNFANCNYSSEFLKYTFYTTSNSDISIQNQNININANVRDDTYDIYINAYYIDENSNILYYTSNNDFSIKIHEKAPLEFNEVIFSINHLTDISQIVDLSSKISVNNLPSFNLAYTSNFPSLRDGYYNGLGALNLDGSNLIINPEYRNKTYTVQNEIYVEGYENQKVELTFNIEECNIPAIEFIGNEIVKSNLVQDVVSCNLRDYFGYPYVDKLVFSSNILTPLETGRHDYNVLIEDNSNLRIEADVRDMIYEIEIKALDPNFMESNEELNIRIQEEKPLEFNEVIFSINHLTDISQIVDLSSKISVNNLPSFNLAYTSNFPSLRDGYYNGLGALNLDGSNLIINPEYRNKTYTVQNEIYVEGYENQKVELTFNIEECNIPAIEFIGNEIVKSNLVQDVVSCNLRDYFGYPYVDKLVFSSNILTPLETGRHDYNVLIEDNSNLRIEADVRDMIYEIEIKALDPNFMESNEELSIRIQEIAPIYYKTSSNSIEYVGLQEDTINIQMTNYFTKTINESYGYNITSNCNLRNTYGDDLSPFIMINNTLTINADYRNLNYILTVDSFIIGYEQQSLQFTINIEESNIPDFDSLMPSIVSIDLTTESYTLDLRNKFNKYPFVEYLDFYYSVDNEPINGRKVHIISINDTSNLVIDGDLRDMNYRVSILAIDEFNNTSNNNFYVDVIEKPPVTILYDVIFVEEFSTYKLYEVNLERKSGWIQIEGTNWVEDYDEIDYNEIFSNNTIISPLISLNIPNPYVINQGHHKENDPHETIDNKLRFNYDFRGTDYPLEMDITISSYTDQRVQIRFNIKESNLPELESYNINEELFKDMIEKEESIDLYSLFNSNEYPFMNDLEFTSNITSDYGNVIIDGSNLIVDPSLRGTEYTINVIAKDKKLPSIINSNINIDVLELPELLVNNSNINIYSSNVKVIEEYLIEKYLVWSCNHYNELSNIIGFEILTDIHNNVELNNNCNILISTDLRANEYNIDVKAYYKKEQNISNNELTYIIEEEYPIRYIQDVNNSYYLTNNTLEISLIDQYEILVPGATINDVYFLETLDQTLRVGYYNGNKSAIEINSQSNLLINPEYRGTEYNISMLAYIDIEPYNTRSNMDYIINVIESNIGEITFSEEKPYNISNLYNEIYTIDLSKYVSDYPYSNYIDYIILNQTESNAYIENSDLIFLAGNEDKTYDIEIKVIDSNFEINDINTFHFYTTSVELDEGDEPIVW